MRATFATNSADCRIDIGECSDYFIKLTAFDELHAEVALSIALAHFIDGNNAWMFEAGGGFGFPAKTLQVRFGGPGAKANHFKRDSAIETFLMSAINHALTASADFLQQFVVAKVAKYFCPPGTDSPWRADRPAFFVSGLGAPSPRPGSSAFADPAFAAASAE